MHGELACIKFYSSPCACFADEARGRVFTSIHRLRTGSHLRSPSIVWSTIGVLLRPLQGGGFIPGFVRASAPPTPPPFFPPPRVPKGYTPQPPTLTKHQQQQQQQSGAVLLRRSKA